MLRAFDTTELRKIQNNSLSGAVFNQLERLVITGGIAPGERINESQLASRLGVSRAPIREACRQLEKYDLVEVRKNKGTFIRDIKIDEALELYDIRAALEALAAEKAAEIISKKQIKTLESFINSMSHSLQTNDVNSYFSANLDFHFSIFKISGNKSLLATLDAISKKLLLFRKNILSRPGEITISLNDHKRILDSLRLKNGKKAGELMKNHVLKCRKAILEFKATHKL